MHSVLVAGGAGFIGLHLCKSLLDQGSEVVCIDNFISSEKDNLKQLLSNPRFFFFEHDVSINNFSFLKEKTVTHIFHLASPASPNQKSPRSYINHPIETLLANSFGTHNLLEFAKEQGARFLYASSSEVYGDPTVSPQHEDYFGNVNPNGTRSVYDEGKRFGEAMTAAYVRKGYVDARIARIFNTYGPLMQADDGRVVSNFITQALAGKPITIYGKGDHTRSFCYISDLIRGLTLLMFADKTNGEIVNLGNPNERTILELATMVKELTNSASEITFEKMPPDDPKKRKPDITKAKQLLGWVPEIMLEDGLVKTITYFKTK